MTRLAGAHTEHGFTLVEMLLTITILSLIIGVLTDTLILGLRTTGDTQTRIAQSDAQQFIAHYVSKDVLASAAATPGRNRVRHRQCGARDHRAIGSDARRTRPSGRVFGCARRAVPVDVRRRRGVGRDRQRDLR